MTKQELIAQIKRKQSFLCVGLDADINKIPKSLLSHDNPILEFNKQIIDATKDYCVAYKPNTAFYESLGSKGWEILEETVKYIPKDIFTIADAKRGDIGNTSDMYAKAFFEGCNFDSITASPYMGSDSITPYLKYENKWVISLALTSNKGAMDFQTKEMANGKMLFEEVLQESKSWGGDDQIMYVVGATRGELFKKVRAIVPNSFLLVPGVGAQGGSLQDVVDFGMTDEVGLLVNSSRGIIYASSNEDFAQKAGEAAKAVQIEMSEALSNRGIA
jgi:orotidine-5'-phosphate decarboxylase